MLNSFWKYASPIKNSIAQNKQTDYVNNNYSYENEILKGTLFIKINNSNIQKISNDCLIEINNCNKLNQVVIQFYIYFLLTFLSLLF